MSKRQWPGVEENTSQSTGVAMPMEISYHHIYYTKHNICIASGLSMVHLIHFMGCPLVDGWRSQTFTDGL